jgi:hypothetical protein
VLLTSVFGPYGVDDDFGRKENKLELFHNQITREQGIFSIRFHHHSFGLYLIAENLDSPVTVLDFPSKKRFIKEIRKGYDYIGISFIVPNLIKATEMARLIRKHAPDSQIVLGGHGTMIEGIEDLVEHDHICRGDGVQWFRSLLNEERLERPLTHPALVSGFGGRSLGIPLKTDASVLIPGVGCPNRCRFCSTSSFFNGYHSFFETGEELFNVCQRIEKKLGLSEFFVMDENFLKQRQRAEELARLCQQHGKYYRFGIFSSAETIADIGVEQMVRLGVYFVWIGVESKLEQYEKNRGIDLKRLIRELRDHGIVVLGSAILFLEQHDRQTIWDDIRYAVDLGTDFVQFMQLGPLPTTTLYRQYRDQDLLRFDLPYEEWHGQHRIWFDHPHFSQEESEQLLRAAFAHDYDTQGPSLLRMAETAIRGYQTLARYSDRVMTERRRQLGKIAKEMYPILPVIRRYAHSSHVQALADWVISIYRQEQGPMTLVQRLQSGIATLLAAREARRIARGREVYQPRTFRTEFIGHPTAEGAIEPGSVQR